MRSTIRRTVIGIVPAAGRATRLPNRSGSKELVAVGEVEDGAGARPRAISEHLVAAMRHAGADRICMVIAPDKTDIARFYGSGERHGVPVAFVTQPYPTGMSDAIDRAFDTLRDATVLMGMPDTIVRPAESLRVVRSLLEDRGCDVALAVAPTDEPWRVGPVTSDATGRVVEILDKPMVAPHNQVWTVAAWAPPFTEFLHAYLADSSRRSGEAPLGLIFQSALEHGFDIRAHVFREGRYIDAGTPDGLAAARHLVDNETSRV